MFTYAQAPVLKRLIESKIGGVGVDDWLEDWTIGTVQNLFDGKWPPRILDIEIGRSERPYRNAAAAAGRNLSAVPSDRLDTVSEAFDLVLALSFERAECLAPVDPEHAYAQSELLGTAARLLAPGGTLVWSYLYVYADDATVHALLEPAAVFRNLILRGLEPLDREMGAREKVRLYHDPETLFVNHRAVLAHAGTQRRIVRIFGAVRSPAPLQQDPAGDMRQEARWWTRWRGGRS